MSLKVSLKKVDRKCGTTSHNQLWKKNEETFCVLTWKDLKNLSESKNKNKNQTTTRGVVIA